MTIWARNDDPETSHEAAEDSAHREAIRLCLLRHYADAALMGGGLTDEEAMLRAGYDLADDGHRRRCSDLRREGLIAPDIDIRGALIKRVSGRTGRARMVCVITPAGIDVLNALRASAAGSSSPAG